MKPIKEITGYLAYKPIIGKRLVICTKHHMIWTSPVAAIRNSTETGIEIETKNTVYKLTFLERLMLEAV
ncbi:MAG: hypothetical protein PUE13_02420 [Clostridiales bacterium]|nr:hypothetical protein [Clostridiales bacterium]